MCSEPLGQIVGPTRNFAVEADTGDAAEVMLTWGRRLACHFAYHAEINRANITSGIKEFPPGV
jgi:hypothetical protein